MLQGTDYEVATRPADRAKSCTLYDAIQKALREASGESETIAGALSRVRALMHNEFRDVTVVRSFVIEDPISFTEWHIVVRYPGGREVVLSHDM